MRVRRRLAMVGGSSAGLSEEQREALWANERRASSGEGRASEMASRRRRGPGAAGGSPRASRALLGTRLAQLSVELPAMHLLDRTAQTSRSFFSLRERERRAGERDLLSLLSSLRRAAARPSRRAVPPGQHEAGRHHGRASVRPSREGPRSFQTKAARRASTRFPYLLRVPPFARALSLTRWLGQGRRADRKCQRQAFRGGARRWSSSGEEGGGRTRLQRRPFPSPLYLVLQRDELIESLHTPHSTQLSH